MKRNLVSVIMPAYNGEQYIRQAIESMLAQTYSNWELIIVDDGSTDNTAQIISSIKDQRIIYVYQENRGQAAALNRGLDLSTGEYVTTLDVDDWFTRESLESRAEFLDNHPEYDAVYGEGIFCDRDGSELKRFSELRNGDISGNVFDVMLSNSFFGTGANVMIRKHALQMYRLRYDESIVWCQDYDLYLRLAEKCLFGYVDSIIVWYRIHQENMTLTMPSGRRKESLVRVKFKALASERFNQTPIIRKISFFTSLLIYDLAGNINKQLELMDHVQFQSLPKREQAMLIRLCASEYLSVRQNMKEVKKLLSETWRLNPLNPKTVFLILLAYYNEGLMNWVFNAWSKRKLQRRPTPSPFSLIE